MLFLLIYLTKTDIQTIVSIISEVVSLIYIDYSDNYYNRLNLQPKM